VESIRQTLVGIYITLFAILCVLSALLRVTLYGKDAVLNWFNTAEIWILWLALAALALGIIALVIWVIVAGVRYLFRQTRALFQFLGYRYVVAAVVAASALAALQLWGPKPPPPKLMFDDLPSSSSFDKNRSPAGAAR
jgi:hypothetical protein